MKKYGKMIKTKTKPNASVSMKIIDIRDEDAAEFYRVDEEEEREGNDDLIGRLVLHRDIVDRECHEIAD